MAARGRAGLLLASAWALGACAPAPDLGAGAEFSLRDRYREALREAEPRRPARPLAAARSDGALSRAALRQLDQDFERLPNPLILLYVFPHLSADAELSPIPGYVTFFDLYERTQRRVSALDGSAGSCRSSAPEEPC